MNDILFGNNNKAIVNKLAKSSFKANKKRNRIAILAITLTTLLIASVFSIGISYFESMERQEILLRGTTAQITFVNPSEDNLRWIKNNTPIKRQGIARQVAIAQEGLFSNIRVISFLWADETAWNKLIQPAAGYMVGEYPNAENEILVPDWFLKHAGIDNPEVGMEIELSYAYGGTSANHGHLSEYKTSRFILSGWYEDKSSSKTADYANIYVSSAFWGNSPAAADNTRSAAYLQYKDDETALKAYYDINAMLSLEEAQRINYLCIQSGQNSFSTVFVMIGMIALIVACGYLLIYNVLYISVINDIHFYGQLKTLGTTERQIRQILYRQVRKLCAWGIPLGLFMTLIISFLLFPAMLAKSILLQEEAVNISFSPFIYLVAAVLAMITSFIGCFRPAKIAGTISPVEALRYDVGDAGINRTKMKKGNRIVRMAYRNVFRNKKSAVLTFTSLFLGLCIFTTITGLLGSMDFHMLVDDYIKDDIVIGKADFTVDTGLNDTAIKALSELDGVETIQTIYDVRGCDGRAQICNTNGEIDNYLNALYQAVPEYRQSEENFRDGDWWKGTLLGIEEQDFAIINAALGNTLDKEDFESGRVAIYWTMDHENMDVSSIRFGSQATVRIGEASYQFETPSQGVSYRILNGDENVAPPYNAPSLLVSKAQLQKIAEDTGGYLDVSMLRIQTDETKDAQVFSDIKIMLQNGYNVTLSSRSEKAQDIENQYTSIITLCFILSGILFFIGIMNFVNTITVSIVSRQREFATLENIGMTKKQLRKMLSLEGTIYWIISVILLLLLGSPIFILAFIGFSQMVAFASFTYPFGLVCFISCIILLVCLVVPNVTFHQVSKRNVLL